MAEQHVGARRPFQFSEEEVAQLQSFYNQTKRKRTVSMNQFKVRMPDNVGTNQGNWIDTNLFDICDNESVKFCDFYTPDDNDQIPKTFYLALRDMHQTPDITPWQVATHFASMLCTTLPSMRQVVERAMKDHSIVFREIKVPSQARNESINVDFPYENAKSVLLVYLSCAIMIMFKNISPNSYEPFMTNRIKALRNKLGVPDVVSLTNPIRIENAQIIRTMFSSLEVKRQLISEILLKNIVSRTTFGTTCQYLCNILAWSEMQVYCFIRNALIITESPVLTMPVVKAEIYNLAETFRAICRADFPQFFRYMEGYDCQYLLERSRVRILASVAFEILKSDFNSGSLANFVMTTTTSEQATIHELVALHRAHTARPRAHLRSNAHDFLMGYDERSEHVDQHGQPNGENNGVPVNV